MLSERRATEIGYLCELVTATAISCTTNDDIKQTADRISHEEINKTGKANKIKRRIARMMHLTLMKVPEGTDGAKVVIIVYCFFETLTDKGIIGIPDDSPMGKLMDWLLGAIPAHDELTQKRIKNGRKDAAKWLKALQGQGYFKEEL